YTASGGDGSYSFYTVAVDRAGDREAAAASADPTTLLDTTVPTSAASAPQYSVSTTITVGYAASDTGSGLASVELWAKAPGAGSRSEERREGTAGGAGSFRYPARGGGGSYSL